MIFDFLLSLNYSEAFLLTSLFLCCVYVIYESYLNKNWFVLYKPITLYALLTLFYCVVGPIISSASGDGSIFYRAVDHREYYQTGLLAALISFFAFKFGFDYKNNFSISDYGINKENKYVLDKREYLTLFKWGERTFLFALICQFIIFGIGIINTFVFIGNLDIEVLNVFYQGAFKQFFAVTVNFFILAISIMFISLLNGVKEKTKFIFYLSICISTFINLAFRWRFFMLFFPLFLIYFFHKKAKPKIIFLTSIALSTFLFFGFIQLARTYGTGIDMNKYQNQKNFLEVQQSAFSLILKASFFDSNVFNTSAGMIYITPSENNFVGITPVLNAIAVPIPREIWPEKPTGKYVNEIYRKIYPGKYWEIGAASLGFAEYYISGGWIALVTLNFLLGYSYKRLWIWFFCNFYDPLAQITYATYFSFLFIIYSRGYLLQITFLYFTIFAPLLLISYFWNRKFN